MSAIRDWSTELVARMHSEETRRVYRAGIPLDRYGTPEELLAAFETELLAQFYELRRRAGLELGQVHGILAGFELLGRDYLEATLIIRVLVLRRTPPATTIGIPLSFVARLVRASFR